MTMVDIDEFSLRKLPGGSHDNEELMILILLVANDCITFNNIMSLAYKTSNLIG